MNTITYKCPNCDGGLVFDPKSQKFKCEYCLSEFTEGELERPPEEPTEASAGQPESEAAMVLYQCPNCGAEIVTEGSWRAVTGRITLSLLRWTEIRRKKSLKAGSGVKSMFQKIFILQSRLR